MTPTLAESATETADADDTESTGSEGVGARWRGRCAWVAWRAGAVAFIWIVFSAVGVAPAVVAATEWLGALAVVLMLLFGQAWLVLYLVTSPIAEYRRRKADS